VKTLSALTERALKKAGSAHPKHAKASATIHNSIKWSSRLFVVGSLIIEDSRKITKLID